MPGRGIAVAVAVLGAAVARAPAAAQPRGTAVKDPKVARKWLATGQLAMQKGSYFASHSRPDDAKSQFESAVIAYEKAIEAGDDVAVYVDLAGAEERLGRLGDAVKHVRVVVRAAGVRPEIARRAASKLDALLARVGLVTLRVQPAGTSITLGGAELGTSPLPEPLVLLPGTYTLSFQAGGFQPKEAELKVEPGSETERTIALEAVKVIVEPVGPPVDEPPPAGARAPRMPLYVAGGVAGAAVLGAGVFGALAMREHATFTRATTSTQGREDARTRGQRDALITDLSVATAVVATGFTVYWYVYRYKRAANPAKLDVVPWVQPQSGGATLAGRF